MLFEGFFSAEEKDGGTLTDSLSEIFGSVSKLG